METTFTEKESLELIGRMISTAKKNLQKGTGRVFLLWGYLVATVALSNLLLLILLPERIHYYSYYVWFAMLPGLIPYYLMIRRMSHSSGVQTYVDQVMGYVWCAFGVSIFTLIICMLLASVPLFTDSGGLFASLNWMHWGFLIPVMLILYGFALFVSGKAYRLSPMVRGAVVCWTMAILIFLLPGSKYMLHYQLMGLVISVVAGYILPGHLLNKKENGDIQGS